MIYQIICLFLVPLCISYYLCREDKKRVGFTLFAFYCNTMILNILSYLIMRRSMLSMYDFDGMLISFYIGGSLLICSISYLLWYYRTTYKIGIYKITTLLTTFLVSNLMIYFLWLLGTSGRMTFELFYLSISRSVNTEVTGFYEKTVVLVSIMFIISISIVYFIFKSEKFTGIKLRKWKTNNKLQMAFSFCVIVASLGVSVWLPFFSFHLEDAYTYFYSEDPFIEKHYVDPNLVDMTWPEKKRNLVFVFVESFESTYFSKDLGGMLDMNLLPNLTELMKEGVSFSDNENAFGGMVSMPQATNTLSGMASTLSGLNYKIPAGIGEEDIANTIPGSTNLNDLLKEQGYSEYFMIGLNINDYGIGPYFRQHGDAKTVGLQEKRASGDLPADYKVWWGFEDSKLFGFAKEDLTEISKNEEPFMYVIATNDTHSQDGYTDPTCATSYEHPMQNSIACEDQMLSEFLRWTMAQPFYENTTVVVVGDHLGHTEKYIDTITPAENRRVFNLILNASTPEEFKAGTVRNFWAGDMFPTVLTAMGVKVHGDRLGLGTNLFSNMPTLLEVYGESYMHESLNNNSEFYLENFSKAKSEE